MSTDEAAATSRQNSLPDDPRERAYKLYYEAFKHLTTLSTGTILVFIALMEKRFETPVWRALTVVSLVLFLISTLSSVLAMFLITDAVRECDYRNTFRTKLSILISLGSFVLGIIGLVLFSAKNFLR